MRPFNRKLLHVAPDERPGRWLLEVNALMLMLNVQYLSIDSWICLNQEDVNNMLFVVHQDSLKKELIVSKMSELNLHLEQADRQFHKDRHRKQVRCPVAVNHLTNRRGWSASLTSDCEWLVDSPYSASISLYTVMWVLTLLYRHLWCVFT